MLRASSLHLDQFAAASFWLRANDWDFPIPQRPPPGADSGDFPIAMRISFRAFCVAGVLISLGGAQTRTQILRASDLEGGVDAIRVAIPTQP